VGDLVLLKVNPRKNSLKLGSCTKLATRFCVPFEILDRIGPVAYMFALSSSMNDLVLLTQMYSPYRHVSVRTVTRGRPYS
jgi:hypothetical protein